MSDKMNQVVVHSSTGKQVRKLVGALGLVLWGIWVLATSEGQDRYGSFLWRALAGLSIVGGCWGSVRVFRKLSDPAPTLILDKDGIVDFSGVNTNQRLPWSEIVDIQTKKLGNVRFIVLRVRDTKSYLSKAGVVGRINGYLSLILYGGPIFLSTAGLAADMDIDELATKLNEFRNRYGDT